MAKELFFSKSGSAHGSFFGDRTYQTLDQIFERNRKIQSWLESQKHKNINAIYRPELDPEIELEQGNYRPDIFHLMIGNHKKRG